MEKMLSERKSERERQPVTKTEQGEQGQTVPLLLRISSSLSVFFFQFSLVFTLSLKLSNTGFEMYV